MKLFATLALKFRRFAADEGGNVLMIFGLSVLILVAITGAGIDFGQWQMKKVRAQHAVDAAALAYSSSGNATSIRFADSDEREGFSRRYARLNFLMPDGSEDPNTDFDFTSGTNTVTIAMNPGGDSLAITNTPFISLLGAPSQLTAQANTTVSFTDTPTYADQDVILAMDMSGSMLCPIDNDRDPKCAQIGAWKPTNQPPPIPCDPNIKQTTGKCLLTGRYGQGYWDSRLAALKDAAKDLVDTVMSGSSNSRFGLIMWDYESANRPANWPSYCCTNSSTDPNKGNDNSGDPTPRQMWLDWSNDKTTIKNWIESMVSWRRPTNSTAGLQRAWDTFKPNFRTDGKTLRSVILLTDGQNYCTEPNSCPTGGSYPGAPVDQYGNPTAYIYFSPDQINQKSLDLCQRFKTLQMGSVQGVAVYTIMFNKVISTNPNHPTYKFLKDCATTPANGSSQQFFFPVADKQGLKDAFTKIAGQIRKTRITQ